MKTRDGCFSPDTRIREDRSLKESCCDSEGRRNCTQSVKCIEHNGCINRDSRKKDNWIGKWFLIIQRAGIFSRYIEKKRLAAFLLNVSSIIILMGGGIDTARDTYTNSMQFSRGKIWNGGKKASRGKIAFRTGIDARFLVYSKLNYSTRKGISERRNAFWNSNGRVTTIFP